jgi:hypothetical protein
MGTTAAFCEVSSLLRHTEQLSGSYQNKLLEVLGCPVKLDGAQC